MKSDSWSLERRVNRAIVLVLALILVLVVVVTAALVRAKEAGDSVIDRWDPALLSRARSTNGMISQETGVRGFAAGKKENFLDAYDVAVPVIAEELDNLQRYVDGEPELERLLAAYVDAYETWNTEVAEPIIARTRAGDAGVGADAVSEANKAKFDDIRTALQELNDGLLTKSADAEHLRERAFTWVWVAIGVGVALLLAVGFLLARGLRRSVLQPIRGLVLQTRAVADGDLSTEIHQQGPAEIETLAIDVETMRAELLHHLERVERARLRLQERSAELARSNDDLEQFAYVASHDLSEPLRKVTNFCQLLERQYSDQLDDKARTYIGFMVDGAKRMQVLINDLLSFSRVGRTTEHFAEVDLGVALDRALSTLDDQISAGGVKVIRGPLPTVPGDPTLLTALLQNLVGNAVKYRSDERPSWVEVTAAPGTDLDEPPHWVVTVADNGIGIDAQYAERIFTIFQRLHLRDAYGGTGIGLALCRKIVDFHRGRIWLAEPEGPGARFQFTLPLVQSPLGTVDDDEPSPRAHA
ncbi:ATP-binding protein [Nocardioides flavescens]|uniref:histidine kinase n=1 Tax=Nocardioides flavescens TaxID=2691959 RepID=A0A6L7EVN9_9ACTN|nr:HAMP domain-containing protein [Nocardioides flavescens]